MSAAIEEEEEVQEKKSCDTLRQEFIDCITKSDCFLKDNKKIKECMQPDSPGVDDDCRKIQYTFFQCKRSLIDMRTRFRGRKGS